VARQRQNETTDLANIRGPHIADIIRQHLKGVWCVGVVVQVVHVPAENASLFFECFPYVCPEPVLVKRSFLVQNGIASCAKDAFSAPKSERVAARAHVNQPTVPVGNRNKTPLYFQMKSFQMKKYDLPSQGKTQGKRSGKEETAECFSPSPR